MSHRVRPNEYGLLQGVNASMMGMAGIVGPVLFTQVFAYFLHPRAWLAGVELPGAPFLLGASLMLLAFVVAWRATRSAAGAPPGAHQGHA